MDDIIKDYKKYKWFFTKSKKLVVGGKSAQQNDDLLKKLKEGDIDYHIMHTKDPGSPFCAIMSDPKKVNNSDLEECAIFTGCFSRAWRSGKQETEVDHFKLSQLSKTKNLKTGTWKVSGNVKRSNVKMKLALTIQNETVRAVPENTAKKKDTLTFVCPGKINKNDAVVSLALEINGGKISKNELLAALPAGGARICK